MARALIGIDEITYGVENLVEMRGFFLDFGLTLAVEAEDALIFETLDKSRVVVRHKDDTTLPIALEEGATVREVIWGAKSAEALEAFLHEIAEAGVKLDRGRDGVTRCQDSGGLSLGFRVTRKERVEIDGVPSNTYGKARRVDQAAPVYDRATPITISHVVFIVNDLAAQREFYCGKLGFKVSDEYPGHGIFTRCVAEGAHHNLFMLQAKERAPGIDHVAFAVRDIYEVMGGGLNFGSCGWSTQLGPGRHPISSSFFWYFYCPGGGMVEYHADEDYCTKNWQPRQFDRLPENYAEWGIAGGIDYDSRRQKRLSELG